MENISRHEHELLVYATRSLLKIPGLRIIGTAKEKRPACSPSSSMAYKTEDVGAALNREGIAVRSGHHCAQPTCAASARRPRSAHRSRSTTTSKTSTRLCLG
jgi:cysteine desulfurase / selenocysteine lyase